MSIKFNNPFTKKRKFLDITNKKPEVVEAVLTTSPDDVIVKIYECGESVIIHSKSGQINCASISNSKGYGYVQAWELTYMLENILKTSNNEVVMYTSPNGVIYLRRQWI